MDLFHGVKPCRSPDCSKHSGASLRQKDILKRCLQSLQSLQRHEAWRASKTLNLSFNLLKKLARKLLEIQLQFPYLEHEHSYLTLLVLVWVSDSTQFCAYCYFKDGVWYDQLLSWQLIQRTVLQIRSHKQESLDWVFNASYTNLWKLLSTISGSTACQWSLKAVHVFISKVSFFDRWHAQLSSSVKRVHGALSE